jgi:hypothetical protein
MNEWNRMTGLGILVCLCLALGLSSAAEAQTFLEPSRFETGDDAKDIAGPPSEGEGLYIYGAIRQFVEIFPMSTETFTLYGGFLFPELSGVPGDRIVSASMNRFETQRDAPILDFALAPVTPNPSFGSVRLAWAVPRPSQVRIAVLDVQGRQVTVLADGEHAPGRYEAVWNAAGTGRQSAPGIYFVRMQTPERAFVRRVIVMH